MRKRKAPGRGKRAKAIRSERGRMPRGRESGTPTAVPARKNGMARRKKNRANEVQEEGCQRRRKGSNGTCWEIRNASSNEGAVSRTAQENTFSGSFAIRGRSRWRGTPAAPALAKEANENHREDVALGKCAVGALLEVHQVLGQEGSPDRHDHSSPVPQLAQQGGRDVAPRAWGDEGGDGGLLPRGRTPSGTHAAAWGADIVCPSPSGSGLGS